MKNNMNKSEEKALIIKAAVEEYINTEDRLKNINKLSKKYNLNRKTIVAELRRQNIEIIANRATKYILNEHVFDKIDTEEKAYWLGFLYADGWIAKSNNIVGLSLSIKDIDHLIKFKSFLNWTGEIKVYETHQFGTKDPHNKNGETLYVGEINIGSNILHNSLEKLGCVPNKSLILTFPSEDVVPSNLIRHFVRGYFDGDGTLGLYKHSKKNPNLEESLMFVGTKPFLEGIQSILGVGYIMQKRNCNEATYRLSYSTSKANKAAEIMYNDSKIYLDRKYNIYKQFAAKKLGKIGEAWDGNAEVSSEIAKGSETL